MKPSHDEIAMRAYELWDKGGRQPGRDLEDWLHAEAELTLLHQSGAETASIGLGPKAVFSRPTHSGRRH